MILGDFKQKYLSSFKQDGGEYLELITSDFVLYALSREVENEISIAQNEMNNEFRFKYPNSNYTDEELKGVIPLPDSDKEVIKLATYKKILDQIDAGFAEVEQEIIFDNEKINDPKTFSQEVTELRSEVLMFERQKYELKVMQSVVEEKYRELNEKWTRRI